MIRPLLLAALIVALPAAAAEQSYLAPAQVDLLRLLPPPPADDGAELAQVLEAQRTRTPERASQALSDAQETVFAMFRPVLGERFEAAAAPLATLLFDRLGETEEAVVGPAKRGFARKRPFLESADVHPAVPVSKSGSYPSGHATRVTLEGIVLASMLPERRDEIFARMADYARSRVIGGVHYPSDIEAGARAGTAAAAVLFDDPEFAADYGPARQQLRAALGLPVASPVLAASGTLTREEVVRRIEALAPGAGVDLAGASLHGLDLSRLDLSRGDFRGADLSDANLFAAKFEDAKLAHANLSGASMGIMNVIRADFTEANLSGAQMFGLVTSTGTETSAKEAPIFTRANLSGARIVSRLGHADLSGANLAGANMSADVKNQSMGLIRAEFPSANLSGASLSGAELRKALLRWANLTGANLAGADLRGADLIGANLTDANLAEADATGADFEAAQLSAATGLDRAKGLDRKGAR